LYTYTK